jgi:hypothetical protein
MLKWLLWVLAGPCPRCKALEDQLDTQGQLLNNLMDRFMSRDFSTFKFAQLQSKEANQPTEVEAGARTGDGLD